MHTAAGPNATGRSPALNGSPIAVDPPDPEPDSLALAAAATDLLAQCAAIVQALSDDAYRAPSRTIRGGTIGKHVRHLLDHFRAAVEAAGTDGPIDYDHRVRDTPMEIDRAAARAEIARLAALIDGLGGPWPARPVRVRVMVCARGACVELRSTLGRELAFATHHAVHHHAMVRAIAAEFGCAVPDDLGTAPSTLHHQRAAQESLARE